MNEKHTGRAQALVAILGASVVLLWVSQCREEQMGVEKREEIHELLLEIQEEIQEMPAADPFAEVDPKT